MGSSIASLGKTPSLSIGSRRSPRHYFNSINHIGNINRCRSALASEKPRLVSLFDLLIVLFNLIRRLF